MRLLRGYYDVFLRTCAKFPSRIAVRLNEGAEYKSYTYSELYGVCEYISQNLQQLKCNKGIIGLISDRNIIIPCVIAAAHKCCTTFMFVDPSQDIATVAENINFTIIITIQNQENDNSQEIFGKKPDKTVAVFDLFINFYNCCVPNNEDSRHLDQHSFIAMTSGSTGEPKHIQVPIQCIQPNIDDLTKMFNIVPEDIIYFSTPLTFDPSMVEILLACMNGASLLIAPDKANVLFPPDRENSITFWQTTPSKFFQHSNADIKNKILSADSTLKALALGGEPLNGIKRLKELKHRNNKTKIFTLYGVTEMSCWACAAELDLENELNDREVPLGACLSETEVVIDSTKNTEQSGSIILVSKTRTCYILSKPKRQEVRNALKYVDTGDLGEVKNGTIYYRGRKDDIIKRFGHKVNLQKIESTAMLCPKVKTCSCVWLPKPMLLVVYFSSETFSSRELSDFLKCKLDDKHWPDKIVRVHNLPTNRHGKISKQIVTRLYENMINTKQTKDTMKSHFLNELNVTLNQNYTNIDQIKDNNFYSIGGTSFLAVSMCNKLSIVCPQLGKLILPWLLSGKHTIGEIIQMSQNENHSDLHRHRKRMKRPITDSESVVECSTSVKKSICTMNSSLNDFIVSWTFNTEKCVDASPTLFQTEQRLYVTVGSHSGKIIVMDAIEGSLQGVIAINSRVEAPVLCLRAGGGAGPSGVVGCHDGTVVCFALAGCRELWKTNVGAMVKSKAVCCNGQLYVAAYDGNVRCLDMMTGAIKLTIAVSDQAISADLVVAKSEYILVGSLSGACGGIHAATDTVAWRAELGGPVFAAPALYDQDKYVVFAEVAAEIHCRTVEKGITIWRYSGAKGNIFSSLYIKEVDKTKWQMVFGCFDDKVYSVYIKNFHPSLHWQAQLTSPVYSTPCPLGDGILAASNNGVLSVLDAKNGTSLSEYHLPNDTFSSPTTYGSYIFIGCRDDNLYSLKYNLNV